MSPTAITAAVVQTGGAPFELTSIDLGDVQPDEVRVRITASGICHTDMLIRDGSFPTPMPVVLGHEGAGVVEEVGAAVTRVAVGDRVGCSYASCGGCAGCATGRPYYCAEFFERNFLATRTDGTTALSHDGTPVHSHFFGQSASPRARSCPSAAWWRSPTTSPSRSSRRSGAACRPAWAQSSTSCARCRARRWRSSAPAASGCRR